MGADIIQAKYEELESIASCFGQWAEVNADMNSRLERAMQTLQQGDWEGKGAAAFFAEMNGEVFPAMRRLIEALEKAQSVTLEVRNIIQDAEEEAARVFQGNGHLAEEAASNKDGGGESWWDKFGEWIHGGLDVAGFIPGFGEIADGVNALIYLAEGRYLEAGISAAAMIPIAGTGAVLTKWGLKAGKEVIEEGVEHAAKEIAQEAVEEGTERIAKEFVEEITEGGAEATAKRASKEGAENISKRLDELSIDPQTKLPNPKSREEAKAILQAEQEGLVSNARRPNLEAGEPNLDFVVDGGYADIKTPRPPTYRSLTHQAQDIAGHIRGYGSDVRVIVDLKGLNPTEKANFLSDLTKAVPDMNNVHFLND